MIERKFPRTRRATQPIAVAVLLLLPSLLCAGNAIHDLFVFYSIGTAERYGEKLPTMIQQAVAEANQVYANAGVAIILRLVGTAPSPIADANGIEATLHAFLHDPSVRARRDTEGADFVVLITEASDSCGWSSLVDTEAYAAVRSDCLPAPQQVLTHEIGHLQGLDHDREDSDRSIAGSYNYGYRVCAADGFRDIMSRDCAISVPRIPFFSSPKLLYHGYALGIDVVTDPQNAADAVRTLNENACRIAAYRTAVVLTPMLPESCEQQK